MAEAIETILSVLAGGNFANHNLIATRAPTEDDDGTQGYSTLSVWFKRNSADWYVCTDSSTGAAVWAALSVDVDAARTFTTMQGMSFTTLADGSTAWDMAATTNNVVITLDESTTLGFPTNLRAGSGIIKIIQGSTKQTFAFHASYKFAGGTAPTITDANNAVDVLAWVCDGTNVYIGVFGQAFAAAS